MIAVLLAAVVGIGVTCSFYYPGVMSPDSVGSYHAATTGVINGSSQPPIMAFLWKFILEVIPSPLGPLLFQNLIFWSGLALIASACRLRARASVFVVLGIGFFPTVFALLGVLWKDILMAGSLTLFVGLVLVGLKRHSRTLLFSSLLPLLCAMAARLNAFGAIPILAAWLIVSFLRMTGRRIPTPCTLAVLSVFFSLSLYGLTQLVNRAIVTVPSSGASMRFVQFSMLHDLAGMAVKTGDLRLPSHIWRARPDLSLDVIEKYYNAADINPLMYNDRWDSDVLVSTDPEEFLELARVWSGAIAVHPAAYISRRADVIAAIYQIRDDVFYPFHTGIHPNDLGLEFMPRPLYQYLTGWLYEHRGWFFRGWFFGLIAAAVSALGIRRKQWGAAAVSASGVFYVLPYIVMSSGADFRYIWWLVVATLVSVVLLFFETPTGDQSSKRSAGSDFHLTMNQAA